MTLVRIAILSAALAGALGLAACATATGVGTGTSAGGGPTAQFTWASPDGIRGTMNAVLSDGSTYEGWFTHETRLDDLSPLWSGWAGRNNWRGWDDWGPRADFATSYSGTVLANLTHGSDHMRCRFNLSRPAEGMGGGGMGRCQLGGGGVLQAEFPPA